jgi:hypothetical protein
MTWLPLQSCHVTDAAIQSNAASAATSFFGGPRCVPLLTLAEARRIAVTARRSPTLPCSPRAVVPPQDGVCGAALSHASLKWVRKTRQTLRSVKSWSMSVQERCQARVNLRPPEPRSAPARSAIGATGARTESLARITTAGGSAPGIGATAAAAGM